MPRERRRRKTAIRGPVVPATALEDRGPTLAGRPVAPPRKWRWRTFPVYFTFALTLFVTAVLTQLADGRGGVNPLVVVGALVLAIGLSHLVVSQVVAPRLKPEQREQRQPGHDSSR